MKKNLNVMIIILLLIIVVSAMINSLIIGGKVYALAESRVSSETDAIEYSMNNWVGEHLYFFENIKDIIDNFSKTELTYTPILNRYLKIRFAERKMSEFYIGFSDGIFTTGTDWVPPKLYDVRLRPWYIKAISEKRTVICEPYIDKKTGYPVVTISSPILENNKISGVVGLDLQLIELNNYMKSVLRGKDFYGIIFAKNGTIIANTTHPEMIGRNVLNSGDGLPLQLYRQVFSVSDNNTHLVLDKNFYSVTSRIPQTDWGMALISIDNRTIKSAQGIIMRNVILNIVFVMVAIILLILFYKTGKTLKTVNHSLQEKITELNEAKIVIEKINTTLELKSKTDGLTKIYNRGYFNEYSEFIWGECLSKQQPVSLIILDIDHFKKYNDYYGHPDGDDVIIKVCDCIRALLNNEDYFARYGGEEFAIISTKRNADDIIELAENIRKAIFEMNLVHVESSYGRISVSLGVNTYIPFAEDTLGNFIRKTDSALYEAKMAGRNRVRVYGGNVFDCQ